PMYRYHPLVREVLHREAITSLNDELDTLYVRIAQGYLRGDAPMRAMRYLLLAGAFDAASTVLASNWTRLLGSKELDRILDAVPPDQLIRFPVLAIARGVGLNDRTRDRGRALELFSSAAAASRTSART